MNEKLEYRAMLDIPENTASVIVLPQKKKKAKSKPVRVEDVKQKVIEKVNETTTEDVVTTPPIGEETTNIVPPINETQDDSANNNVITETEKQINEEETAVVRTVSKTEQTKKAKKGLKRVSLVKVQVAIIGALIGVILLTSVINKNSGINTFMRGVFAPSSLTEVDERLYTEFAPVFANASSDIVLDENGIITTGGSVYSPVNGEVESVTALEDGTFEMVVKISENFSTKISGLKFTYLENGQKVTTTLPLGYADDASATMCFIGEDGEIIKDFSLTDNSVIWAV